MRRAHLPIAERISVRVADAVRMTGISRSRLYELMKAGDVEYVKLGSSTLILADSLRRFIEGRRARSATGPDA
jgi:hypothetical protein